jgi:beta-lactamase regulating signal transducer with metallopeptidase domain
METTLNQITNYLLTQSWQIAVLAIVIAAASQAMKNRSAHVRYLLWLIVLAKCLVPPLFSIPLPILPQDKQAEPIPIPKAQMPAAAFGITDKAESEYVVSPSVWPPVPPGPTITERLAEITIHEGLGFGWIAGAAAFLLFALIKALRTNRWLRRQRRQLSTELQTDIENFFTALGIGPYPKIWLVDGIGQPFVWGLPRGGIYLPAHFVRVDNAQSRRSVLMHELSHILRFDATVNLLQVIVQAIFWFHPFVWWANRNLRQERERCCDEMAIARLNASPKDYSSAIVETLVAEQESAHRIPSLAIAGPVRNIEDRIKSIMWPGRKFYKRPGIIAVVSVFFLATLTVPTTLALTTRQVDTPAGPIKDSVDVLTEPDSGESSTFAKGEKVFPYGIEGKDLRRQIDELREILQGEFYSIHTGRRDDEGSEVIIIYFKGEKAEHKPLVFHLAEEDRRWVVDYFYVGSSDTERQELLGSRKKISGSPEIIWSNGRMIKQSDIRLTTADNNPIGAVDKQIRQLREILKVQYIEHVLVYQGDGVLLVTTKLMKVADGKSRYVLFHHKEEDKEYRIECLEALLVDESKETRFEPWKELPEPIESRQPRSKTEPGEAKVRVEGAFDAAFEKIKQLSTAYRNRDWGTMESSARDLAEQQLEVLNKIRDTIQAYAADDYDERILRRIVEGLDELSDELNDAIQEKKEDTMKRILWGLEVLRQDYRLLRGSKNMSWRQEMSAARVGPASCLPRKVASQLPDGTGGYALEFDGQDDFVMIPPSRSLDIHGSLTVSAWVKHSDDRHGVIIWRGDGATDLDPYALQFTEGRIIFRMDMGNGRKRYQVVSKKPVDDQWHFWTAVCNKEAAKLHLYRDGHLEDTADIDVNFDYDTSEMWNMFGAVVLSRFTNEHFKGSVDEVRIWNAARSQDQVREYMNRSLKGTEPGLAGYWKFDEDKGDIIKNSTAYLNNGVAGKLLWDI